MASIGRISLNVLQWRIPGSDFGAKMVTFRYWAAAGHPYASAHIACGLGVSEPCRYLRHRAAGKRAGGHRDLVVAAEGELGGAGALVRGNLLRVLPSNPCGPQLRAIQAFGVVVKQSSILSELLAGLMVR
jgi:hypothetical protein